ncbi:chromosome partitioning protein ParB, partial [Enterococcus faecalis]|nr:chromosome partitioning protein ParB [Enterococcus faecalis]
MREEGIQVPLIVNENFEIINGQNRYILAKKYKKLIPYIVIEGLKI